MMRSPVDPSSLPSSSSRIRLRPQTFAYGHTFIKSVFNHAKDVLNHVKTAADEPLKTRGVHRCRGYRSRAAAGASVAATMGTLC